MNPLLIPGLVALGLALGLTPLMRRIGRKTGMVDRPGSDGLAIHSVPISCLGGGAILPALLAGPILAPRPLGETAAAPMIIVGAILVFVLGAWDDRCNLSPRFRLAIHFVAGAILVAGGLHVRIAAGPWIAIPLTLLIVAATINAANMTDGMDGLAAGISAISALGAVAVGVMDGDPFLAVTGGALLGAVVGFLPFNFHRASIFLGDGGSGLLGFWIAVLLIRVMSRPIGLTNLAVPTLLFALPLTDMVLAMGRRLAGGVSMSSGDRLHLYDRLLQRGLSQPRVWCVVCGAHAVLVLLALAAAFVAGQREAAPIERAVDNRVINPSFEFDRNGNGIPDGWRWRITSAMGRGPCIGRWDEDGAQGNRSIAIDEGRWGSSSRWTGRCGQIEPHTWYALSLQAKRDRITGWTPCLKIFGETRNITLRRAGAWQRFEWMVHSGSVSGDAPIDLVCYKKPYKVWFDDIRLTECRTYLLEPVDGERITMRSPRFKWQPPEIDAVFDHVLEISRDRSFLDMELAFAIGDARSCALSHTLPAGQWFWRVRTLHNEQLVCRSDVRRFFTGAFSPERPAGDEVWVGDNMVLRINGQPFFPLGLCGSQGVPLPREDAAFNTVMGDTADAAPQSPLRSIPRLPASGTLALDASREGLLAWWLCDEPGQHNVSPRAVRARHRAVKVLDGNHPTVVVVYRPENFSRYAKVADIMAVDPYPIPHRPITMVSDTVDRAVAVVRDRRPVWAIIQAFDWTGESDEARRSGSARLPTAEEERCMAYLAVIHGARGVFFYVSGKGRSFEASHWVALDRVMRKLQTESPAFIAPPIVSDIRVVTSVEAGAASPIDYSVRADGQSTYLLVANVQSVPVEAKVEGLPPGTRLRELFGRSLPGTTIHFNPLEARTFVLDTREG